MFIATPFRLPRYRPRFGLRALFIVVTLLSAWLAWNLYVVERRGALRAELEQLGAEIDDSFAFPLANPAGRPRVSYVRYLLGDRPVWGISFPPDCPAEVFERFQREFPETPDEYQVY